LAEVLIIEDDPGVVNVVGRALQHDDHVVLSAGDGTEGLQMARRHDPDLIIVDVQMPRMDGWEVCRALREDPLLREIPVIFLTAEKSPDAEVGGFELGADDYVTKPFDVDVLRARVGAALRSRGAAEEAGGVCELQQHIRLVEDEQAAIVDGERVELTPTEHNLLRTLLGHAGEALSVEFLLQRVWGYPAGTGERTLVRRYIHALRTKIEDDPGDPEYLVTVRSRGYMLTAAPDDEQDAAGE
jgi:DNA-binding response OmpR family regulator